MLKLDKYKILAYRQEDEAKYQEEVPKLTAKGQTVILCQKLTDWRKFYKYFLFDRDFWYFSNNRGAGKHTQKELLALARRILNKDGIYTKELEKFDSEKRLLTPLTGFLMKKLNLYNFEPFFYQIVTQNKYFDFGDWNPKYLPEFYRFIESYCAYLGVEAPKKNIEKKDFFSSKKVQFMDQMLERRFEEKFAELSQSTRSHLYINSNSYYEPFYYSYMSYVSPLNDIYNQLGESALIEVLRLGQMLADYKKELEVECEKEL